MGRLIDADEAIEGINQIELNHPYDDKEDILEKAISIVVHAPTVDAVPVVHGKWKLHLDGSGTCNQCRRTQKAVWDLDSQQNFCGHCGAKMDLEE